MTLLLRTFITTLIMFVYMISFPFAASAAISYGTPGATDYSTSAGGTVDPVHPASIASGDILILIIGMKPSSANGGSVTTPNGWSSITSLTGAGGYGTSLAADTGNTNIFGYYKIADGTEDSSTLSVTVTTNGVSWGKIFVLTGAAGASWSVAGTTGSDTSAGNVSITFSADPGVTSGDYILGAMNIPTDVSTPSQFSAEALTQTSVTFGAVTEVEEPDSTVGNDIGGFIVQAPVSSGTGSAAPVMTATAGGTTTNVRGPGIFIRIREVLVIPTVTTQAESSVTQTSATVNGTISSTGGASATVRGFAWGTNATLTGGDTATTTENGTFGTGAFTGSLSSLTCNTTYYSRPYATNSVGTGYGTIDSFTTSSCVSAPTVTTSHASYQATDAILVGTVSATGGENATQSGFAYGTNSTLSTVIATTTLGSVSGAVPFSGSVGGLSANTTYYYRAYATNTGGTGYGSILNFTTGNSTPARMMRLFEGFTVKLFDGRIVLFGS